MILGITGGTGFVGQALIDQARHEGFDLAALTRRPKPERKGVNWISGDLDDKAALRELVRGCDVVFHVAGVVNAPDPAGFEQGNVIGTLNLVEAAVAENVRRLVVVSSLSAREPELSVYGASKARAEKLVMASGLNWTIVRPPWVYGPGDRDTLDLFKAARWGVMPMPPREGRSSLIHVQDLAELLMALVPSDETVTHRCFEPDDGKPGGWSHYEMARAVGWAMGRRPWVVHLSRASLERAARADRALRKTRAKLTLDRVGYMTHPDWVVSEEARPPAGLWKSRIPTREGLRETAQWYRDHQWL